jgi:hypothetical protein
MTRRNPRRLQEVAWFDVFFESLKSRGANRRTGSVLARHFRGMLTRRFFLSGENAYCVPATMTFAGLACKSLVFGQSRWQR